MLGRSPGRDAGRTGLKTVCTVYSGLVPISPNTTPSAPSSSAPRAVRRFMCLLVAPITACPNLAGAISAATLAPWGKATLAVTPVPGPPGRRCGRRGRRPRRRAGRPSRTAGRSPGRCRPPSAPRACPSAAASAAQGQLRSPWKMWPPGIRRSASTSCGILASMQGRPSRVAGDDRLDRVDEVLVERGDRARDRQLLALRARRRVGEQRGGQVQAEVRQRVGPVGNLAQDRGIGQRVAVDLARQARGDLPGGGLRVGPLERRGSPRPGAGSRRTRSAGPRPTPAAAAG